MCEHVYLYVCCVYVCFVCVLCVCVCMLCTCVLCVLCVRVCMLCTCVICVCCVYVCVSRSFTESSGAAGRGKDDLRLASGWVQTLSQVWVALICLVLLMPVLDSTYVCQEPPGNVPRAVMAPGWAWSPVVPPSGTVNGS